MKLRRLRGYERAEIERNERKLRESCQPKRCVHLLILHINKINRYFKFSYFFIKSIISIYEYCFQTGPGYILWKDEIECGHGERLKREEMIREEMITLRGGMQYKYTINIDAISAGRLRNEAEKIEGMGEGRN
ncbi:hypothetical protein Q3G72_034900 [Acer saccharum]|nr:hypothetical protein Q3G72_034900 [Acer saccharum]